MGRVINMGGRRVYKELDTLLKRKRQIERLATDLVVSGKLDSALVAMGERMRKEGSELALLIGKEFPNIHESQLFSICINAVRRAELLSEARLAAPKLFAQVYKIDPHTPFAEQLARKELNEHLMAPQLTP